MSWTLDQVQKRLRAGDFKGAASTIAWTAREHYYEKRYGIASLSPVRAHDLGTDPELSEDYDPTSYQALHRIFDRLARRGAMQNQSFLDVGCGKGRVLVTAALQPYAEVIGIELSPQLIEIARANIEHNRQRLVCKDVKVIEADATAYQIPRRVGTVFLYNPFNTGPIQRFMQNVHTSVREHPRELTLVFVNPVRFDERGLPWLRLVDEFSCFYPHYEREMQIKMFSAQPG